MRRHLIPLGAGVLVIVVALVLILGQRGEAAGGPVPAPRAAADAVPDPITRAMEAARTAAIRRIEARRGGGVAEVLVMRQEAAEEIAVCGRVMRQGGAAPFVVRVILPPGFAARGSVGPRGGTLAILEEGPGIDSINRDPWRRYCEPPAALAARQAPPTMPLERQPEPEPAMAQPIAGTGATIAMPALDGGGGPAGWEAVLRGPANLRDAPSGRGNILRTAKRGEVMLVRGEAPGGWFQVGDEGGGEGWIHGSLLEHMPPR